VEQEGILKFTYESRAGIRIETLIIINLYENTRLDLTQVNLTYQLRSKNDTVNWIIPTLISVIKSNDKRKI